MTRAISQEAVMPGSPMAEAIMAARRALTRRVPFEATFVGGRGQFSDPVDVIRLQDAFGTRSSIFARHMLNAVNAVARSPGAPITTQDDMNVALAFVCGCEARTELDGMAATLLFAANNATLALLERPETSAAAAEMLRGTAALYAALAGRPVLASNDCQEND